MASKPRALVMMATFNGADWVEEQLDSICAQEDVDVFVRICDDRSSDNTLEICEGYAALHPNVRVTQNDCNLGVARNFMQMVYEESACGFDLYAFSDQDDVWVPGKLARAANMIRNASTHEEPVLYYSDIVNVSSKGRSREISRFAGCEAHPATVLVRNYVNGCAMVWNESMQALARLYEPHTFARIHDVWMHMLGRYCGTIVADLEYVGLYRRLTGRNVVGATTTNVHGLRQTLQLIRLALPPYARPSSAMAEQLARGYEARLNAQGREVLADFLGYANSLGARIRVARSANVWLPTLQMRIRARVGLLVGFY